MSRTSIALASSVLVAAWATAMSLPSKLVPVTPSWTPSRPVVAGAFHVHTSRSDGSGSIEEVARAASGAKLAFVVLTDHGDGTRPPLTPVYRSGVLVIDGVEISTTDGHYAAAGLAQSPYPLGGEGRDVSDDVRRLGGFGVAAHGESPHAEGQWRDWDAPIDGLEWLNLDASWRNAPAITLARGLLTYWLRPAETLASTVMPGTAILARFDRLAARQRMVALASADAHGHALASYEACFRTLSIRVELEEALSGDAVADASAILRALARGHHYTAVDGLAVAPAFEFTARQGHTSAGEGDVLAAGQQVTFESRVVAPPGAVSSLLHDGVVVYRTESPAWRFETEGNAGAYRVEVSLTTSAGSTPRPWIVSNPMYVGGDDRWLSRAASAEANASVPVAALDVPLAWQAEHDGTSQATVDHVENGVRLRYALGPGAPTNQYAAAAATAPRDLTRFRGIRLTARADRPLRVSVQLRADRLAGAPCWQRSLYLDSSERTYSIAFDDMRPVRPADAARVPLTSIDSLLVLSGLLNGTPASAAEVNVTEFRFEP